MISFSASTDGGHPLPHSILRVAATGKLGDQMGCHLGIRDNSEADNIMHQIGNRMLGDAAINRPSQARISWSTQFDLVFLHVLCRIFRAEVNLVPHTGDDVVEIPWLVDELEVLWGFVFIVHFSLVLDLQIELISCPIRSVEDVANGIVLLVNNDAALEPVMSRVADEEKYVHETDQAGFASPALIVDQNFPRMDIALAFLILVVNGSIKN